MKKSYGKLFLVFSLVLIIILPYIAVAISGRGLPPAYGEFPPMHHTVEPDFNLVYFTIIAVAALVVLVFLFFPTLFGFKKVKNEENSQDTPGKESDNKGKFPKWFWPCVVILLISWALMWFGSFLGYKVESIANFSFLPLWWSFILIIDGFVYKRTNGKSLVAKRSDIMVVLAVFSMGAWCLYEFLNYFVLENWYYPGGKVFTQFGTIIWYFLSYGTVWPAVFEWYDLLNTFGSLKKKYSNGPRIPFSKLLQVTLFAAGILLISGTAVFPHLLFWGIWIGPLLLLSGVMGLAGFWTPYIPIKKGNWSLVVLMGLAAFFNGFFWEFWNHGSNAFHKLGVLYTNPNYWQYEVPYVDVIHIFSEMPILGYFGYIPFGLFCWILWLLGSHLFGFDAKFNVADADKNENESR